MASNAAHLKQGRGDDTSARKSGVTFAALSASKSAHSKKSDDRKANRALKSRWLLAGAQHAAPLQETATQALLTRSRQKAASSRRSPKGSVPLGGLFEADLDDLFGVGDVIVAAISFPAVGDNLKPGAAEWGIGNVGDALVVGLHV